MLPVSAERVRFRWHTCLNSNQVPGHMLNMQSHPIYVPDLYARRQYMLLPHPNIFSHHNQTGLLEAPLNLIPLLMQILQIHLGGHLQPAQQITSRILFLRRPAVAPIAEPALALLVAPLPVLPARLLADEVDVGAAAGPHAVDAGAGAAAVVPALAVLGEDGLGEEGVAVGDEVVGGGARGRGRLDVLPRHLAQQPRDVGRLCFGGHGDGAGDGAGVGSCDSGPC